MTSKADFALPPHIQRAVDNGIDPFEIIQGEILNKMLDLEATPEEIWNWYQEGQSDLLTELRTLGYNVVFAITDKEKLNGN